MPITLNKMISDMSIMRNPYNYPTYKIINFAMAPAPGIKSITYKCEVQGEGDNYTVFLQVFDVNFSKQAEEDYIKIKIGKTNYWMEPQDGTHRIKVKCQCPDQRFTWEKEDYDVGSIIGAWRRYTPVKPPSGYPPRNPDHVPGFCKHIYSLIKFLDRKGYMIV